MQVNACTIAGIKLAKSLKEPGTWKEVVLKTGNKPAIVKGSREHAWLARKVVLFACVIPVAFIAILILTTP